MLRRFLTLALAAHAASLLSTPAASHAGHHRSRLPTSSIAMSETAGKKRASVVASAQAEAEAPVDEQSGGLRGLIGKVAPTWTGNAAIPDEELRAIFEKADSDDSGEVDRDELANALFALGYRISMDEYDTIFDQADDDGGGTITFEEFKEFIKTFKRRTSESQRFATELFEKYDIDQGGTLDAFEFAALAEEVEANYKRRTFLTGVAAAVGALVVGEYDTEFAFAQKTFRGLYIEKKAEETQNLYFPTALLSSDMDDAVARTLGRYGFTPANTLFGHSVCSDEVNNKAEQLIDLMVGRWKEGFSLGGLGGLPFAGKSGFRAYLHHAPDSGKLLMMFAPHVGIDAEGRVGALQREGQTKVSKACGAALGSYKAIQESGKFQAPTSSVKELTEDNYNFFDPELKEIIKLLTPRLKGVDLAAEPISFVTYQMYTIVRDLLEECVKETDDVWEWVDEVAIVGGVLINRASGGDFFQPLSFELRTEKAPPRDLFVEAFGPRPDLLPVLGSEGPVKAVLEGDR